MNDLVAAVLAEAAKGNILYLVLGLLVGGGLLRVLAPEERGRLRGLVLILVLCLLLLPAAAVLRAGGDPAYAQVVTALLLLEALAVIGLLAGFLFAVLLPRLGFRAPRILRDVLVAAAAVVTFFVVASRSGFNVSGLIATSTVLTAVIGLSLQDTLGNLMAGLALQMDQSVQVGQWIKMGDMSGRVTEMRWRATSVETRNWETLVIPNSVLVKNQFLVLGQRDGEAAPWRRWVHFNVDFRYAPTDVIAAVEAILTSSAIPSVAKEPAPHCILMELHESYARYAVRYWLTDVAKDDLTDSVVRTRVYFALKRSSIPLSMPAQAVFVTEESGERKSQKSEQERQRRLDALAHVQYFDHLSAEDRAQLASGLHYAPFAAGEVMTRQGAEGHWLYLILSGEADIHVHGEAGLEREVATLRGGQFFGEMSLLTGAPRQATVVAATDVVCYRLDKNVFQEVLRARPDLAGRVAAILAERTVGLQAARQELDEEAHERRVAEATDDLLERMRQFFGLRGGEGGGAAG
jgi:small-conductance mechanosensitive channel/CRP-like cAMP-binding protein